MSGALFDKLLGNHVAPTLQTTLGVSSSVGTAGDDGGPIERLIRGSRSAREAIDGAIVVKDNQQALIAALESGLIRDQRGMREVRLCLVMLPPGTEVDEDDQYRIDGEFWHVVGLAKSDDDAGRTIVCRHMARMTTGRGSTPSR